jgi:hypothetical protein
MKSSLIRIFDFSTTEKLPDTICLCTLHPLPFGYSRDRQGLASRAGAEAWIMNPIRWC